MRRLLPLCLALAVLVPAGAARASDDPFAGSSPAIQSIPALDGLPYLGDDGATKVVAGNLVFDLASGQASPIALPMDPAGPCNVLRAGPQTLLAECFGPPLYAPPTAYLGTYDGAWTPVPQFEKFRMYSGDVFTQYTVPRIGRNWLEIGASGHEGTTYTEYMSVNGLKNGQQHVRYEGGSLFDFADQGLVVQAQSSANLNSPFLPRRLCAPIVRPAVTDADRQYGIVDDYALVGYNRPWVVTQPPGSDTVRPITLQHCGSKAIRTLCKAHCGSYALSGQWLAWPTSRGITILNLDTNRLSHVSVPQQSLHLVIVGDHLVVVIPTPGTSIPSPTYYETYWGPYPMPSLFGQLTLK